MATSPSYNPDTAAHISSLASEVSRSTEGPSAAQWAAVKEEIRVLYEKKPLRDVKTILEKRHGFRATYVSCPFPLTSPPPSFCF